MELAMPLSSRELEAAAQSFGASVARVADLARLQGLPTIPDNLFDGHCRAISIAARVSDAVIDAIQDRPTPLYQQHYQHVNAVLDQAALKIALLLQEQGAKALPIPASQTLDRERWRSYLSHKAVAVAAGVGWQGKSLLTIHPKFGPRIRLVTVLTNAPLTPDPPLKNRCGSCDACSKACPAQAIKNNKTQSHFPSREDALHFERCVEHLTNNCAKLPHIGSMICGVCIKVCPWGRAKKKRAT
jgi:epoxyqueuosine reductase QueG